MALLWVLASSSVICYESATVERAQSEAGVRLSVYPMPLAKIQCLQEPRLRYTNWKPMPEVEYTGQRCRMTNKNGQNVIQAE